MHTCLEIPQKTVEVIAFGKHLYFIYIVDDIDCSREWSLSGFCCVGMSMRTCICTSVT